MEIKKLGILLVCLTLIVAAGYIYFDRFVLNGTSELDTKTGEEQKTELLTKEEFAALPEVQELKEQEEQLERVGVMEAGSGQAGASPGNKSTAQASDAAPSKADIENRLKKKLVSLQGEYNGKLEGLIASAKGEYHQIVSGQRKGSKSALADKYLNLAQGLEAQCDARVYAAIAFAENELQEYGYQSSMPEQARQTYQQQKKERRKQLLSKI
ncbi:hypothetical protein JCM14036_07960 [Desulfotomaculum defluvii]